MEAYFNDFQKTFLAENPCDCNQFRPKKMATSVNALNHFHKSGRYQRSDIKDNTQDTS